MSINETLAGHKMSVILSSILTNPVWRLYTDETVNKRTGLLTELTIETTTTTTTMMMCLATGSKTSTAATWRTRGCRFSSDMKTNDYDVTYCSDSGVIERTFGVLMKALRPDLCEVWRRKLVKP